VLRDYITLTKPKITGLNILTAVTSYLLAGGGGYVLPILVAVGFLSVGGASALNHYLDRDLDGRMRRTSKRPLAAGRIKPPEKALIMGGLMLIASAIISSLFINVVTTIFTMLGAVVYLIYTVFLKRVTMWNIVIGGLAGSFAPLAGWAAHTGGISLTSIMLAVIVFLWTPGHFWSLAMRAARDYRAAGIPMLPSMVDSSRAAWAITFSNILSVAAAIFLGLFVGPISYLVLVIPVSVWLLVESIRLTVDKADVTAWRCFKISSPWLAIVFLAATVHLIAGI
jgi:protoheme IX farnesyltransferase